MIADDLRKSNIAEYLLHMWQMESLVRAYNRDIDRIDADIISKMPEQERAAARDWFENIIKMMELENVRDSGHLQINKNVIIRLADLHKELLKSPKFPEYGAEFYKTLPFIVELRAKSGEDKSGEIETCFNALYGLMMLRLNKKEVSPETLIAFNQISKFVATLAAYFKKDEEKPLFDNDDEK